MHKRRHRADGLFNWNGRIDAMLVIQIDGFNAEALQACIARLAHIFRTAVDAAHIGIGFVANDSEFSGEKNLGAQRTDGHANQYFVVAITINVRGIEKGDAELDGTMDGSDRFHVVTRSIEFRHPHAAQTHCGDERTFFSELTLWHEFLLAEIHPVGWKIRAFRYRLC